MRSAMQKVFSGTLADLRGAASLAASYRFKATVLAATLLIFAATTALMPLSRAGHAASCSEIVVGASLALTGRHSTAGNLTRDGYEFALDQIAKVGGILAGDRCYRLRVIYADNESDPKRAAEQVRQLISRDRVRFLLGPSDTQSAAAVALLAETSGVPIIMSHDAALPYKMKRHRYVFAPFIKSSRHFNGVLDMAAVVARNTGREPSALRISAAFAANSFDQRITAGLRDAAAHRAMKLTIGPKLGETPVALNTFLSKVKRESPDVLIMAGDAGEALAAASRLSDMQIHVPLVVLSRCRAANLATQLGGIAENLLCTARPTQSLDQTSGVFSNATEFERNYRMWQDVQSGRRIEPIEAPGAIPDTVAQAATAVHILATAIEKAANRQQGEVREALANTDMMTMFGPLSFGRSQRLIDKPLVLRQIQNGSYNLIGPSGTSTHNLNWPRSGL